MILFVTSLGFFSKRSKCLSSDLKPGNDGNYTEMIPLFADLIIPQRTIILKYLSVIWLNQTFPAFIPGRERKYSRAYKNKVLLMRLITIS